MEKQKNQRYIGDLRIKDAREENGKVHVELEDGSTQVMRIDVFKSVATKDKKDKTDATYLRIYPVSEAILQILLEYDFKLRDWDFLVSVLKMSIDDFTERVQTKKFGKHKDEWTFGFINEILTDTGDGGKNEK